MPQMENQLELRDDVMRGMNQAELMRKHSLSMDQLLECLVKLVKQNQLNQQTVNAVFNPAATQQKHFRIERIEPEFPENIWMLSSYKNPFRIVILIIVCLNLYGLVGTYFWTDFEKVKQGVQVGHDTRGVIKRAIDWLYRVLWQDSSPDTIVIDIVNQKIENAKRRAWYCFIASVCLLWVAFDWDRAMAWTTSAALGCLLVAYFISPIDLIPDIIPVIGTFDDVGVAGGGAFAIFNILTRYHNQRAHTKFLESSQPRSPLALAEDALKVHGLRVVQDGGPGNCVPKSKPNDQDREMDLAKAKSILNYGIRIADKLGRKCAENFSRMWQKIRKDVPK